MTKWLAVLAVAGLSASVMAVPTMRLSDGTTTFMVQDGSALDVNPLKPGVITYDGAVGNDWLVKLTGALGSSAGDGAGYSIPSLDLGALRYSGGPATLTVAISDIGFLNSPQGFDMTIGGALKLPGTVTYNLYADPNNQLFGTGVLLASFSPDGLSVLGETGGVYNGTIPYSVTMEIVVSTTGSGQTPNNVPDAGATAMLLGGAVVGLALLRRRFTR